MKICLGATKDNPVSFRSGHTILSSLVLVDQLQLQEVNPHKICTEIRQTNIYFYCSDSC